MLGGLVAAGLDWALGLWVRMRFMWAAPDPMSSDVPVPALAGPRGGHR